MGESGEASKYRPFVDGLRAVAILAVMGFHVGVPHMTGGFVGVDVFFVISGFLIIGQLRAALDGGNYSLLGFWARRVLRILPPYLLVVGVSVALAQHVLASPESRHDFFSQVVWSAFMAANHYFLSQQGYFDTAADVKPLLHLWSLAVEEQFYLIAPLALSGLWALRRRFGGPARWRVLDVGITASLFLGSLAACVVFTGQGEEPNVSFFVMPLRAWEFIAGGVLGAGADWLRRTRVSATALAFLGLAMIVGAVVTYDESTRFPSYTALLPVVGTSLLIVAGLLNEQSLPIRLLATRPCTALGLVSYSWYLWHWPLLALFRAQNFSERRLGPDLLVAFVALGLAVLTYWLVERPIRLWRQRARPTLGWGATGLGLAACAAMATVGFGYRPEVAAEESEVEEEGGHDDPTDACNFTNRVTARQCMEAARRSHQPVALVIGDSHGSRARAFLKTRPEYQGVVLAKATSRACPPIFGVRPKENKGPSWIKKCIERKQALHDALRSGEFKPDLVIVAAYWHMYTGGGSRELVSLTEGQVMDPDELFRTQLRATLEEFHAHAGARILVLGPTPNMQRDVPGCAAQAKRQGRKVNDVCAVEGDLLDLTWKTRGLLQEAAAGLEDVKVMDSLLTLCPGRRCLAEQDKELLYLDRHHLSPPALERVFQQNAEAAAWVRGD